MAAVQSGSFFEITADGTFQAVTLTASCDVITIGVRNDTNAAAFTQAENPQDLNISFNSDGTGAFPCLSFAWLGPFKTGDIVCYASAETANIIVVNGLVNKK